MSDSVWISGFVIDNPINIERGRRLAARGITDPPGMLDRIGLLAWHEYQKQLALQADSDSSHVNQSSSQSNEGSNDEPTASDRT